MARRTRRCRYGKLKNPRGRRICKRKGHRSRCSSKRRSRRMKVRTPFILAGVGALALLAYTATSSTA